MSTRAERRRARVREESTHVHVCAWWTMRPGLKVHTFTNMHVNAGAVPVKWRKGMRAKKCQTATSATMTSATMTSATMTSATMTSATMVRLMALQACVRACMCVRWSCVHAMRTCVCVHVCLTRTMCYQTHAHSSTYGQPSVVGRSGEPSVGSFGTLTH